MTEDRIDATVRIAGRVQRVGFRDWTRREARALGLSGWARNEPDGSVLARFAGPRAAVETMLRRCESGPPAARVLAVTPTEPPARLPVPDRDDFQILF